MFAINLGYVSNIRSVTEEMSVLGQVESYFLFTQNTYREMLYDSQKPILNTDSFTVAKDSVE